MDEATAAAAVICCCWLFLCCWTAMRQGTRRLCTAAWVLAAAIREAAPVVGKLGEVVAAEVNGMPADVRDGHQRNYPQFIFQLIANRVRCAILEAGSLADKKTYENFEGLFVHTHFPIYPKN